MKKMLFIGVAALLATISIHAGPTEGTGMTPISIPAVFSLAAAAGGTTNLATPLLIEVSKQQNTSFQLTSTAGGINGCTNQYFLASSLDGVSFDTNAADLVVFSNSVVGVGTSVTTVVKPNAQPIAINYYKLITVVVSGISSNNAFGYSQKIGFP